MRSSCGKMHLGVHVTLLLLCLQGSLTESPPTVQVGCPLVQCLLPCSVEKEEEYEWDEETGCQTSCECVPKKLIAKEIPPDDQNALDDQVICPKAEVQCGDECEKRKNAEGCDVCKCPECPSFNCDGKYCMKVQHPDLPHCSACECYPPPPDTTCRDIPCAYDCKDMGGFKNTSSGCPTCECSDCPDVACDNPCLTGFKKDENGCFLPTCECDVPECPMSAMFRCLNTCSYGYKKDYKGCMTCECNTPKCPAVECEKGCQFGLKKNDKGCDICECNPIPTCQTVKWKRRCRIKLGECVLVIPKNCPIAHCAPVPRCKRKRKLTRMERRRSRKQN